MKENRQRYLSIAVIGYMVLAIVWWTILLYSNNERLYQSNLKLITHEIVTEIQSASQLESQYNRKKWMILGEGFVIIMALIGGINLINQAYKKEVEGEQKKRNFLLGITHELKSPIASIKLGLETIAKPQLKDSQRHTVLKHTTEQTSRLEILINDLLLSARIEHQGFDPILEKLNIHTFLTKKIDAFKDQYPKYNIVFEVQCEANKMVTADSAALKTIITNLIENAIKYTPINSDITLKLHCCKDEVVLSVKDSGIGIADIEKNKIFDKFYRVGPEETRKTKGTGLGLFIVDQMVKAHNWSIEVSDNLPKGSIFSIKIKD